MFKILSLDGGGIRGAFTAAVLAEIESRLDRPIGDYFDLVAGTSTGGLIATAVASGLSASKIVDFYQQDGPAVFAPRPPFKPEKRARRLAMPAGRFVVEKAVGVSLDDVFQTKYPSHPLVDAVSRVFGDLLLGDITKCRLVIPAVDVTVGRTVVFKTPHLPNLTRDRHYRVSDVLLATTAAPTYFPHAMLNGHGAVVDGGLWANNPSLVAYTEAMKIRECAQRECDPSFDSSQIEILSIGTGEPRYSLDPPGDHAGIGWWGPRVFDVASISQSQGVSFQLQYLLDNRYTRVNFDLPDESWTLDSMKHLPSLFHKGRTAAHDQLAELLDRFFSREAPDYVPFDDCTLRSSARTHS
ncbi:patatin-like phospholipase family protein [Aeoliella sp. ICT_H6.2]|uniref:Patatin-like phospholipase family protein n=1 Tax=Aeoliella straminimaris TaxID=2954799 RepID=A0A9X2F5P7_9BACT|nr:CBASS cGAMP-activated phospholipase [Aeoliella straminimaris]MCO6042707.1 patatin-like phospholipase family protein [Aeoliella straminimaris]